LTTPTRQQIEEYARQIYATDQFRRGCPELGDINPTVEELKESGTWSQAVSELMLDRSKHESEQWSEYNEQTETSEFKVDVTELFNEGCLILGSKHSGKSDLGMMISDKAIEHNAIVTVFDPSLDWLSRANISKVVRVKPNMNLEPLNESAIYDVSRLSPSECVKVVEKYAKILFEKQATEQNRTQRVVIFEECHLYFSHVRSKEFENCVRLLSVGRNVAVCCVLISQFACLIDKYAVRQVLAQTWLGWTKEPNDLRYLEQLIGDRYKELPLLNDGEFLYLNRRGITKIAIIPYENNNTQKTWIVETEPTPQPIEPIKPLPQKTDYGMLVKLAFLTVIGIAFLWSLI
jgi:hypothetical protein